MSSRRKASSKSRRNCFVSGGFNDVVPKIEFEIPSVDPEDVEAYREANVIVKLLNGFRLSIGQIYPCGLQHIVGILVLSYELGVTLDSSTRTTMAGKTTFSLSESFTHPWRRVASERIGRRREDEKPAKTKIIAVSDDIAADGQDFPGDLFRHYLNSGEPVDLDELFDFEIPPADNGSNEVPYFAEASRTVNGVNFNARAFFLFEARMAQFKADMADKEIARLKGELERSCCSERGSSEADIRRAYRRGRKDVAEIVRTRRERVSHEFGKIQASYKVLGEYHECRGTAGGLYLTTDHDYLYDVEHERQSRRMNERNRDFAIPQIERRIWEHWDPIPISHDTVEAEMEVPDEMDEVDQPAPPDANDQLFGGFKDEYGQRP
ncbi:hypothetical protein Bca4012_037704 [Brassica carinata]